MRYLALATDYDGTIAQDGHVPATTVAALEKLRGTGRRLILVTGRELDELLGIFPDITFFDRVVAENGALLYEPATRNIKILAEKPSEAFVEALRQRGVGPISVGHVIVATWKPHETPVLETIRDFALELQVIFNKDAVMILPAGVNKASGLKAALQDLELSPHEVVGVGDAENDHAFLSMCECSAAVDNALQTVKDRADVVLKRDHGPGVEDLIGFMLDNDLADLATRSLRHHLVLGQRESGDDFRLAPYGCNVLVAGPSGSGKSTVSKSLVERFQERHLQFCVIDPEGDYDGLEGAVTVGNPKHGPAIEEILQLLRKPDTNVVVNLVGMPLADRPPFFLELLPRLQEMRGRVARPHWIIVDEAHHLLPSAWLPGQKTLPRELERVVFITVHPELVARPILDLVSLVVAVGREPGMVVEQFCTETERPLPPAAVPGAAASRYWFWPVEEKTAPFAVNIIPAKAEHRRHIRKYAEGELPPERSFFFRGPEGKLNLRAQNLILFNQIAEGVDDETWLHHLAQGDYSRWFRDMIGDDVMADEAERIEQMKPQSAADSRARIKSLIERYYTMPASAPLPLPGTAAEPQKGTT